MEEPPAPTAPDQTHRHGPLSRRRLFPRASLQGITIPPGPTLSWDIGENIYLFTDLAAQKLADVFEMPSDQREEIGLPPVLD